MRTSNRASWVWCVVAALAVAGCDLFGEIEPVPSGSDADSVAADAGVDVGDPVLDSGPAKGPDAAPDVCAPTEERCNGVDDDCDGQVDEGCVDGDGDGWCVNAPDAAGGEGVCAHAELDCDDDAPLINPGQDYVCGAQRSCPRALGVPVFGDQALVAGDPSVRMMDVVVGPNGGLTALWLESTVSGSELRVAHLSSRGVLLDEQQMLRLDTPGAVENAALAWDPAQSAYAVAWVARLDDGTARGAVQVVGEDFAPIGAPFELGGPITPTRLQVLTAPGVFTIISSSRGNGAIETDLRHNACALNPGDGTVSCSDLLELNVTNTDLPVSARFQVLESGGSNGGPAFGALMEMFDAEDLDRLTLFDMFDGSRVPYTGGRTFRDDYALPSAFSRMAVQRYDVTGPNSGVYTLSGVPTGARNAFFVFVESAPDGTFGEEIARVRDTSNRFQPVPLLRADDLSSSKKSFSSSVRPLWMKGDRLTYLLAQNGTLSLGELAGTTSSSDVDPVTVGSMGWFNALSRVRVFDMGSNVVMMLPERQGFPLWSVRASEDPPVLELDADLQVSARGASLSGPFRATDAFALPEGGHAAIGRDVRADGTDGDWEIVTFGEGGDFVRRDRVTLPDDVQECATLEVSGGDLHCQTSTLSSSLCTADKARWVRPLDGLGAQVEGAQGLWVQSFVASQTILDSIDPSVCCLGRVREEHAFELTSGELVVPYSGVELDGQGRCVLQNATFESTSPLSFGVGVPYDRAYEAYGRWSEFLVFGGDGDRREAFAWDDLSWGAQARLARAERFDDVGAVLMAETDDATYVAHMDSLDRVPTWIEVPAPIVDPAEREEAQSAYTLWNRDGSKGLYMAHWDAEQDAIVLSGFEFEGDEQTSEQVVRERGEREARLVPVALEGTGRILAVTWRVEPAEDALGDRVRHEVMVYDQYTGEYRSVELPTDQVPSLAIDGSHMIVFWVDQGGEFAASYDLSIPKRLGVTAQRRFYGNSLDGVDHWPLVDDEVRWLVRDGDALRMGVGACVPPESE